MQTRQIVCIFTLPMSSSLNRNIEKIRCSPTWRYTCTKYCFDKIANFDKNKVFSHVALKTIENLGLKTTVSSGVLPLGFENY